MVQYFRSIIFWFGFILSVILLSILLPPLSSFFKEREKFYAKAISFVCRVLLIISAVRVEVVGKENLKKIAEGRGLIIVANHASFLDYFVLKANFNVKFVVWWSGFRIPLLKTLYEGMGYIGTGEKREGLLSSYQLYKSLKEGCRLIIFGDPSMRSEEEFEFADGVIRLSASSGTPILPVAIKNSSKVLPLGKLLFQPGKIKVKIGKPDFFDNVQKLQGIICQLYKQI